MSQSPQACNFIKKETLAQVFSCEFFEISKNTFSYRTPLVAASLVSPLQFSLVFFIETGQIKWLKWVKRFIPLDKLNLIKYNFSIILYDTKINNSTNALQFLKKLHIGEQKKELFVLSMSVPKVLIKPYSTLVVLFDDQSELFSFMFLIEHYESWKHLVLFNLFAVT